MAFPVSPGVNVSEIDLSNYIANVSTNVGALVGKFAWGPLNEIITLGSEADLVARFHKPDANSFLHFLVADDLLSYSGALRAVRVTAEGTAKNAVHSGTAVLIKNRDHYDASYAAGEANVGQFAAKYCGTLGNSLKFSICPSAKAFSQTLTGTVSTTGTAVNGTTTSFDTELVIGSRIWNAAGTEFRIITDVADADSATINAAFTVDLSSATVKADWEYKDQFGVAPGTSTYAAQRAGVADEMHIIVVDEDGVFTGTPGTVLEKFYFVSKASDAKNDNGTSNFYKTVINETSKFLYWMDKLPAGTNWETAAAGTTFTEVKKATTASMTGGIDGNGTVPASDYLRGWALFAAATDTDISYCIGADADATVANYIIDNICESRKDCVGFFSPEKADVVNNLGFEARDAIAFRNTLHGSSYAAMDSGWKKKYDRYNGVERFIPMNGDSAGLHARTAFTNDPWWSAAGFNRGRIKNVINLAYNPGQKDRDDIYLNSINPIINEKAVGPVLFGDKTLLAKPSAFDRLNVRFLFITLEKAISQAAKFILFEFNDYQTRLLFKQMVDPFLRDVKARRGIYEYLVVCDERNNTAEVIDRNEFVGDIYIKPAKSINFIQLNFIATKTGAKFEELINVNLPS